MLASVQKTRSSAPNLSSGGSNMSLRARLFLPVFLSALGVLTGCGGNGGGTTNPVAPPSGSFSNSNFNGTYVFSVSGVDFNGAPFALAGTLTANGQGQVTSGAIDINNAEFSATQGDVSTTGNYSVQVDGRGQATLNATTQYGSAIVLDFVLENSSHGLVTEADGNATGSGTIDLQSSGVTPTGTYAFLVSGGLYSSGDPYAAAGDFTIGNSGAITGTTDVNDGGLVFFADQGLSGTLALGPSASPATTLLSSGFSGGGLIFDVFAIDATHLKFIEMDQTATLIGDAYAQTSPTMPTGTLAFTIGGCTSCTSNFTPVATGGFMVTDGSGNITSASTEDFNVGGSVTSAQGFSGSYTAAGTGRYTLGNFTGFAGGNNLVAYPSSGGVLILEVDNSGLTAGAAYLQTPGATFASAQGYGVNMTGTNLAGLTGSLEEIDDIAEFTVATGGTITGALDENYQPGGGPAFNLALEQGQYASPDSNGRGQISSNVGNSNNSTLNGGFDLTFYTVDGTNFPFIETDSTQVAVGTFVLQNPTASSSAAIRTHMFVAPAIVRPHGSFKKQK